AAGCREADDVALEPPTTPSTATSSTTTSSSTTTTTGRPTVTIPGVEPQPSEPGAVLWERELDAGDLPGRAWQVTYRSRSSDGDEVAIGGIVAVPEGEPPPGGFPVLAWAHGTTGIADRCAPSERGVEGVPRLREHLEAGWAVAATDYEGLGTPGTHPYLVAESEARSVLDSVRAARELLGADVVSGRVAVLGHSQGGHAALATAERASTWAPELELVGTAAIAPVADLELVLPVLFDSRIGIPLGIYVAAGWPDAHGELSSADLLSEDGLALLDDAAQNCLRRFEEAVAAEDADALRIREPAELPAWAARIEENTIDASQVDGPVLIAQGGRDALVPAPLVDPLVDRLCERGEPLRYLRHGVADHESIVGASMPATHRWLAGLLAGEARDDCDRR
ncbi:MAG: alpha/beta fold hydrolase, partial [Acidimicrobiia bacterium]